MLRDQYHPGCELTFDPNNAVLLEPRDIVTVTRGLGDISSMTKYAGGQGDQVVCRKECSGPVAGEKGEQDTCCSSHALCTKGAV